MNRVRAGLRLAGRSGGSARAFAMTAVAAIGVLAGCGGGVAANPSNGTFSIAPGTVSIDTNCTGCNAANSSGASVEQLTATLVSGGAASVTWKVSGGDANSGAGTISASGQYTPPSYLTADSVQVTVTATLESNPSVTASAVLTLTPGFLQPLTPENAAVGANGTLTVTGYVAEAGGHTGITYGLSSTASGLSGGQGSLGATYCTRGATAFTYCTVTYTAPATITGTGNTYLVATVGSSSSKTSSNILLNAAGVSSDPATHETKQTTPVLLGSSGGNNNDYDASGNQIVDCCGGTLGSLIQNSSGTQYLLSNNHVLARSDQASVGETIVQPGLIDDSCMPFGLTGAPITPVGTLTGFLPLKSAATNADAAIAAVNSGAVSTAGNILELGALQGNGTLGAAPPGISSTGGKGESAVLNMSVAKSGRTTGLTCANISAVNLDVSVGYFTDCAETKPYLTKIFKNQIAISGNQFSDAGDSGSLVVDSGTAEPVGLFFAGGVDTSGVSVGVANPVGDVLNELSAQLGGGTYSFVGGADHAVSCLSYGNSTVTLAQARVLSDAETARAEAALGQARMLVNPGMGILGVGMGKSSDHAGEAAVILYVDASKSVNAPATVGGVRTIVIPTTARAVMLGVAPETAVEANAVTALKGAVLSQAVATKQQIARSLMRQNPSFFGVGVGQSLDNPQEAALVVYVDRRMVPAQLPATVDGLRTRYVVMDRLHVTRSYAAQVQRRSRCMVKRTGNFDLLRSIRSRSAKLY
ncbi:MAG TPA: hypothetical protein VMW15_16120 [Terracidiphilus sp.]|nr:hypothetical protein [Terracidiphilus sp.]